MTPLCEVVKIGDRDHAIYCPYILSELFSSLESSRAGLEGNDHEWLRHQSQRTLFNQTSVPRHYHKAWQVSAPARRLIGRAWSSDSDTGLWLVAWHYHKAWQERPERSHQLLTKISCLLSNNQRQSTCWLPFSFKIIIKHLKLLEVSSKHKNN